MAQTNYTTLGGSTSNWTGLSGLNKVGVNRTIRLDDAASFQITDLSGNLLLGVNQTEQVLEFATNSTNPNVVTGGMFFDGSDFYVGV